MTVRAWQEDWQKRIYERLSRRGIASVTAFADTRPTATLEELASELAVERDVAAGQVERLLRHEAEESGRLNRFARVALVRSIREFFPSGWMRADRPAPGPSTPNEWARASLYTDWRGGTGLREAMDDETHRVFLRLEELAPEGWLPSGPDDPIILQAFREGQFPEDSATETESESSGR